jgi:proline iminopeptidase
MSVRTALHPPIEPHDAGLMPVSDGHRIYWEVCGNPDGEPALFLHGGPGGGCTTDHRRLFDPAHWRIVLFDQRGCGRSRPSARIEGNHTGALIDDIEALRRLLGIERWLVLGGSWGSTLALAYAQRHPHRVRALILRGVFLARQSEIDWLYRDGASHLYPEAWAAFQAPIPPDERDDLVAAYHRRLIDPDPVISMVAASAWCAWERALMTLLPLPPAPGDPDPAQLALARLEAHYFVNDSFLERPLLEGMPAIAHIPGHIVQGRHDCVTPATSAWTLHQAWPDSTLEIIADASHASGEPGIQRALVAATERFARRPAG